MTTQKHSEASKSVKLPEGCSALPFPTTKEESRAREERLVEYLEQQGIPRDHPPLVRALAIGEWLKQRFPASQE